MEISRMLGVFVGVLWLVCLVLWALVPIFVGVVCIVEALLWPF